jgi:three-Cys-motif partner protein
MLKKKSTKEILRPHSIAKINLYVKYLAVYLNILHRVDFIKKTYLFDLFAGEGIYEDGGKGSPIQTMETIKNHYFFNKKNCKNIDVLFNDYGNSDIEIMRTKIDRVKEFASKIFKPPNVNLFYSDKDYNELLPLLIGKLNSLADTERALLFIDPWGYKEIRPNELKDLLVNGKAELILFLPISFMYRFAEKAITEGFKGGEALEKFLTELFGGELPDTTDPLKFILSIKQRFKEYLNMRYIDSFTLRPDKANVFCIFFFTHSKKGFEKMIHTKWMIDKEHGKGFEENTSLGLFDEVILSGYDGKLRDFIINSNGRTNSEINDFGYENGFLPTHSNDILKILLNNNVIELISLDGKKATSFYLGSKDRKILIKRKE